MSDRHPLTEDQIRHVVRFAPLITIDLIISDPDHRILVGLRNNEPAKGFYFVPGGRIRKDETREAAFSRLLLGETGLSMSLSSADFAGVYEQHFSTSRFCDPAFGTHCVVLGYRLALSERPVITVDDQHSDFRWMSAPEILTAPDVHSYTKDYFRDPADR